MSSLTAFHFKRAMQYPIEVPSGYCIKCMVKIKRTISVFIVKPGVCLVSGCLGLAYVFMCVQPQPIKTMKPEA